MTLKDLFDLAASLDPPELRVILRPAQRVVVFQSALLSLSVTPDLIEDEAALRKAVTEAMNCRVTLTMVAADGKAR